MGIYTGAASYQRYRTGDKLPDNIKEFVLEKLKEFPFKEINLNVSVENYCIGRVSWLKSNSTDGGLAPVSNIYFTRGTPDIANPDVMVNNQDSNIVYMFPCPKGAVTQPFQFYISRFLELK